MIVVISGSRHALPLHFMIVRQTILEWVSQNGKPTHIYHGACKKGVDTFAPYIARELQVECKPFPAKWFQYGNAAGPIRNEEMCKEASQVGGHLFAFRLKNAKNKGTNDCIHAARRNGLNTTVVDMPC